MPASSRVLLVTLITFAAHAQAPAPVATLRSGTQLVTVDVVVTDSRQNPVHGLSASDFTVTEDGTRQTIRNFEEHTSGALAKAESPLILPPGNFTNYTDTPSGTPLNVLLIDTLNTPLQDQAFVHNQLRLFLGKSSPNAPLAIFGLSSGLFLLQSFTADPRLLEAAIIAPKSMRQSPLEDSAARGDDTQSLASEMLKSKAHIPVGIVRNLRQFEAQKTTDDLQLRTRYTLEAFNQLARYLAGLPGRKNLIWFSGSFPINILPNGSLNDPHPEMDGAITDPLRLTADSSDMFRKTAALLAASRVAVYPIDAKGDAAPSIYSVDGTSTQIDLHHPDAINENLAIESSKRADDQVTMLQMAEQTGGHAFLNTNGLADAVSHAITAGSNFYTLTYTPTNKADDGRFRRIQLKLARQGYTVAYRRGYYADPPSASSPPSTPSADPMQSAMAFGSPAPTEIILKVLVVPAAGTPETSLPVGNYSPASAHLDGPYRRYDVKIAVDPADIVFSPNPDGGRKVNLLFRTYLYTERGTLVNTSNWVNETALTPELYARTLHGGLFLHEVIAVPMKGTFYLRIGVHDVTADRDGAVEVPVASVKDLPPAVAAPRVETLLPRH